MTKDTKPLPSNIQPPPKWIKVPRLTNKPVKK